MLNTIEAMEKVTVTIRLGSRAGAGLLLSSLQRVELHRHRVWRYNTLYQSGHVLHSVTVLHSPQWACSQTSEPRCSSPGPQSACPWPWPRWPRCCLSSRDHQWRSLSSTWSQVTCHMSQWGICYWCYTCNLPRQHFHICPEGASPLAGGRTYHHNPPWEERVSWWAGVIEVQTSLPFPDAPSQGRSCPFTPSHL